MATTLKKSLDWVEGTPELPGVYRRVYFIAKRDIVGWPTLNAGSYTGNFTLKADAKWGYIDIQVKKSKATAETQGEYPSHTYLGKGEFYHPSVCEASTNAAAVLPNIDAVYIVSGMDGKYRVLGSDKWETKTTVAQDMGQDSTGTVGTTIAVEAPDVAPMPFYSGTIETEDGVINPAA